MRKWQVRNYRSLFEVVKRRVLQVVRDFFIFLYRSHATQPGRRRLIYVRFISHGASVDVFIVAGKVYLATDSWRLFFFVRENKKELATIV